MRNPEDKNNRNLHRFNVILAVVVLLLVVLMSAFLVRRCLVFDEEGAHVIDRYGVLAEEGSSSGLIDYSRYGGGSGYVAGSSGKEEKKNSKSSGSSKKTKKTEAASSSAPQEIRAVVVSAKDLAYDDDYRSRLISLKEQGLLDTIIVDLKNSDGYLCTSVETSAVDPSAVSSDYADVMSDAVADVKNAGIRVVGRVYCFRDDMATRQNPDISCWYGDAGTNWTDAESHRWLDPTDTQAVQYLCDIIKAGADLGCDELTLAECCYPSGQTDLITFDKTGADPSETISGDLSQMEKAAGDVPVGLWMDADVSAAAEAGQDITALYDSLYRISAPQEDVSALTAMKDGGAKAAAVYTDREAWQSASGTAIFDTAGDLYQIFNISS